MFSSKSAFPVPLSLPRTVNMFTVVLGSTVNLKFILRPSKLDCFLTTLVVSLLTKVMKSLSVIVSELFRGKLKTVPFSVLASMSINISFVGPLNENLPVP
ncbi:hypothetical protein D3C85_1379330 [compost metagenome]